jgi:hypothetical protein
MLVDLELSAQRIAEVVGFARCAYNNGASRSDSRRVGKLRLLVVQYIAPNVNTIGKHAAFQHLLEEGGELVDDL